MVCRVANSTPQKDQEIGHKCWENDSAVFLTVLITRRGDGSVARKGVSCFKMGSGVRQLDLFLDVERWKQALQESGN
jgi:hypothetical protein